MDDVYVRHARWLREYARGLRGAAAGAEGELRGRLEDAAGRLMDAAAALSTVRTARTIELADYVRVGVVARRLGVNEETARRLMRDGRLAGEKWGQLWLCRRDVLEEFAGGYVRDWDEGVKVERRGRRPAVSPGTVRGWRKGRRE